MTTPAKPARARRPKPKEPTTFLAVLDRAIRDPKTDMEKVRELIAARNEEVARIAKTAFIRAKADAQADFPAVVRDAANTTHRSRYATYERLTDAIQPVLLRHGFTISYGEDESPEGFVALYADVGHRDGHVERFFAVLPLDDEEAEGNEKQRTLPQRWGTTVSYGRRYIKLNAFDIAVKGEDNDAQRGSATIDMAQQETLTGLLVQTGMAWNLFLDRFGIGALDALPASRFAEAKTALERKIAERQANTGRA